MASERDLKAHFEAILGRELTAGGGEVALRETVALYSTEDGQATSIDIGVTGSSTKRCGGTRLLTLTGLSFVGARGEADLRLSDFQCGPVTFLDPAFVVATPRTASPVFATATSGIIDSGRDVRIVLHTWAAGGDAAPNVVVTWLCRVRIVPVIF